MGYSLSSLLVAATGAVVAMLLAVAFAGGVVTAHPRHWWRAKLLCQLAACATAGYPILWARGAQYSPQIIAIALASWGACVGLACHLISWWYRTELRRPRDDSKD
jgi:hypothetical protein